MRRGQHGEIGKPLQLRQDGAEAHQAFGASIRDKYRFVRRDQWGRLPLTLREPDSGGEVLPQLPPTILQQIAIKLQLLMPLNVQWEAKEREWLTLAQKIIRQAAMQVRQESERKAIANHEANERLIIGSNGTRIDVRTLDRSSERARKEASPDGAAAAKVEQAGTERTVADSAKGAKQQGDWSREDAARKAQARPEEARVKSIRADEARTEQAQENVARKDQAQPGLARKDQAQVEVSRTEPSRADAVRSGLVKLDKAGSEQTHGEAGRTEQSRLETTPSARAGSAKAELPDSDRARGDVRGLALAEQASLDQDHRVADLFGDVLDWTETKRMAGRLRALVASPVIGQRLAQEDEGKAAVLLLQIGSLLNRYAGTRKSIVPINHVIGNSRPTVKSEDQFELETGKVRGKLNWQTQKPLWQRDASGMVWRMTSTRDHHQQPNWMEGAVRVLLGRIGDAGLPLAAALAARDEKVKQAQPIVQDRREAASRTTRSSAIRHQDAQQFSELPQVENTFASLPAGTRQVSTDTNRTLTNDGIVPSETLQRRPIDSAAAKREQRFNRNPVTMTLRRRLGETLSTDTTLMVERLSKVRRSVRQLHGTPDQLSISSPSVDRRVHPASAVLQRRIATGFDSPVSLPLSGKKIFVKQTAAARADSLRADSLRAEPIKTNAIRTNAIRTNSEIPDAVLRELQTVHGKLIVSQMRRIAPAHILHRERPSASFPVNRDHAVLPAAKAEPLEQTTSSISTNGTEAKPSSQMIKAKSSRATDSVRLHLPNNNKRQISSALTADETPSNETYIGPSAKGALTDGAKWGTILFVNRLRLLTVTTPTTPGGVRTERIVNRRSANTTKPKSSHIDSALSDLEKKQNKTKMFDRRDKQQVVDAPSIEFTGNKESRKVPNRPEVEAQNDLSEWDNVLNRARGTLAERVSKAGDQGLILVQRRNAAETSNEQVQAQRSSILASPTSSDLRQLEARIQTGSSADKTELKRPSTTSRTTINNKQFNDGREIKAASARGSLVERARNAGNKGLVLVQRRMITQTGTNTAVIVAKQRHSDGGSDQHSRIVQPTGTTQASLSGYQAQDRQRIDGRTNDTAMPTVDSNLSISNPAVPLVQRRAHKAAAASIASQVVYQSRTGTTRRDVSRTSGDQLVQRRATTQSEGDSAAIIRDRTASPTSAGQAAQQTMPNQRASSAPLQRSILPTTGRMLQHRMIAQAPGVIGTRSSAPSRIPASERNAASTNPPAAAATPAVPAAAATAATAARQAGALIQRQTAARAETAMTPFKPASLLVNHQSVPKQMMTSTQAPLVQRQMDSQSKTANLPAQPTLHYAAKPSSQAEPDFTRSFTSSPVMQHHASKAAAAAAAAETVRQSVAAMKPPAAPTIDVKQVQQMLMNMPQLQPDAIADKVFKVFEKKMKFEQRRSGY
ncbi:hypothetical protein [Paenibacillus sp. CF384]|uniref:hypothetical protein n=1 Tax=Paenibacillus sp. CF384 TaxID=1884382 RepID=UPI0008983F70|nr:hypothetical protein [Paenibacillus sp. CF384]SDW55120.1 hypothetical protein SAMN05518855_100355 [Paenibacillus sp. CF384]